MRRITAGVEASCELRVGDDILSEAKLSFNAYTPPVHPIPQAMKLALIATVHFPYSHADVISARWLAPTETDRLWGWNGPHSRIVSTYIDQFGTDDIARETWSKQGVPIFPSIADALTLGGEKLAVDGVLLIGEHGEYPLNECGQKLYPRKEFFDQITEVYESSGRSAPVFCDKHFSWSFEKAREMVASSQRLGFLLLGGSSLPHCRYWPPAAVAGAEIEEMVGLFHRPIESYAFHSLETVQSLIEDRRGGETGVRSVTAWVGDSLRQAEKGAGWPAELLAAAADAQPAGDADDSPEYRDDDSEQNPDVGWTVEYLDGLRVTHVRRRENPHGGFSVAFRRRGSDRIETVVPLLGTSKSGVPHFACLAQVVEQAFVTGEPSFPIERTLLTTGLLESMMHALLQPGQPLLTPHLDTHYTFSGRSEVPVLTADELLRCDSCAHDQDIGHGT